MFSDNYNYNAHAHRERHKLALDMHAHYGDLFTGFSCCARAPFLMILITGSEHTRPSHCIYTTVYTILITKLCISHTHTPPQPHTHTHTHTITQTHTQTHQLAASTLM